MGWCNFLQSGGRRISGGWQGPEHNRFYDIWHKNKPSQNYEDTGKDAYYPSHKAIDFYHHYKEDIRLFGEMGFKVFRLSIAWSRIYPNGDELQPNRAGLEFYHDVFHTCHAYGIEPLVTICHYDMPHALSVKWNGWADRRCIELFERYCRTLFAEYGHEVKYWLTFNEMNILTAPMCGYLCAGIQPAGAEGTFGPGAIDQHETPERRNLRFQALHHQFVASAKVVALAHEMMPAAKIGCMMSSQCTYPRTCDPDDLRAAQEQRQIVNYFAVMFRYAADIRGISNGIFRKMISGSRCSRRMRRSCKMAAWILQLLVLPEPMYQCKSGG